MGFLGKIAAGVAKGVAVSKATGFAQDRVDDITGAIDEKDRPEHFWGADHSRTIRYAADHPGWEFHSFMTHGARVWEIAYEYYMHPYGDREDALREVATEQGYYEVHWASDKRDGAHTDGGRLRLQDSSIKSFHDRFEASYGRGRSKRSYVGAAVTLRMLGSVPLPMRVDGHNERVGNVAVDDFTFLLPADATDGIWRLHRVGRVAEGGITTKLTNLPIIGDLLKGRD